MVSQLRKRIVRIIAALSLRKRLKQRRHWIHPMNGRRNQDGEHLNIEEMYIQYPEKFFQYTRLAPPLFDKLFELVGYAMEKNDTNFRKSIPARHRLFVILSYRYLSTGDNLRTIATNFSMGITTVWKILRLDMPKIWSHLKTIYMKCTSQDEWKKIADDFEEKWNYPNCLGAVDGKHVVIQAPPKSGSLYLNYKGTFSIVLMATCDANYKFTTVDVGGYGKQSDGGIFSSSKLGSKLQRAELVIPPPSELCGTNQSIPYHFVGDEAFPLTLYLMRPYPGNGLDDPKRIFNYRLSRARRCIENSFGIMAARWRIFGRVIQADPKYAENVVLCAVILHNFIQTEEAKLPYNERLYYPPGYADTNGDCNGVWRREANQNGLEDISKLSVAAHQRKSKKMREDLKFYFNNTGRVEWQNERANIQNN